MFLWRNKKNIITFWVKKKKCLIYSNDYKGSNLQLQKGDASIIPSANQTGLLVPFNSFVVCF